MIDVNFSLFNGTPQGNIRITPDMLLEFKQQVVDSVRARITLISILIVALFFARTIFEKYYTWKYKENILSFIDVFIVVIGLLQIVLCILYL